MAKTAEFIKLLSVLVLCALLVGVPWYFIPQITALSVSSDTPVPTDKTTLPTASSAGYGELLSRRIKQTLERVSGQGTVDAYVIADIYTVSKTIRRQVIKPRTGVLKEQTKRYDVTDNTNEQSVLTEETNAYDYATEQTTQDQSGDHIRKLSITVLIDGHTVETQTGGTLYQPRSQIEMAGYRALVESLTDYTPERGDTLQIINLPFAAKANDTVFGFSQTLVVQSVLLGLLFILCVLILIRFVLPMIYMLLEPTPVCPPAVSFTPSSPFETPLPMGKSDRIKTLFHTRSADCLLVLKKWLYAKQNPDNGLTGLQKAAVLLLSLGEDQIKQVFLKLTTDEVITISRTMAELGCIKGETVQAVFDDFLAGFEGTADLYPSRDYIYDLVEHTVPDEKKQTVMQDVTAPVKGKDIWEKLEKTDTQKLAAGLSKEYPQTIAVVLYHLSNEKAGAILNYFSESLTMDVLMRLTALQRVDEETLAGLEKGLEKDLTDIFTPTTKTGKEKAAGIISLMDKKTDILNTLFERSPELASQLSSDMVLFEDIASWPDQAVRTLLEHTERTQVIYALKGASDKIKEAFSRNMSPAVWGSILKETNKLSAVKLKDIDTAQNTLLKTAQQLIEKGIITLK
ncbi:MAG: FliG C-terminal domain-containing protein [Alphaproteobacteria bacterium]